MPRSVALNLLERVFELPAGSLTPNDLLADQWESIALLGFMAAVDEEFGVVLSPQKILACKTIGDILKLIPGQSV